MAMAAPTSMTKVTAMRIDPILTLSQWLSPAYPVGAFSYSHGLEAAIHSGAVSDAKDFAIWLSDAVQQGAGRNDVILLAAAWHCSDKTSLLEIDSFARALTPSLERYQETDQQGAAFAKTTEDVFGCDLEALTYPVAIGRAARTQGLPLSATARLFLHAFATNLTSAAMRLVPIGQTAGHKILHELAPLCQSIADQAIAEPLDAIGSATFAIDIASMNHETQYTRLFRS